MENIVFLHLARRYRENRELFYYTTSNGRGVDFVIKWGGRVEKFIQVTYELREEDHGQFILSYGVYHSSITS